MRHHTLKIDPGTLDPIISGAKPFDVRRDDRTFMPGDTLLLRETAQSGEYMKAHGLEPEYTGKELRCRITFVLRGPCYGVPGGWAVLGIRPVESKSNFGEFPRLLYQVIERLGGQSGILTIVGSWGDTLSDEECVSMLKEWLEDPRPDTFPMFHSPGAEAICRERRRQVEQEGYTAEHDARHSPDELAHLAAYYCIVNGGEDNGELFVDTLEVPGKFKAKREGFPFPTDQDLVRAGALVAAALDRMGMED